MDGRGRDRETLAGACRDLLRYPAHSDTDSCAVHARCGGTVLLTGTEVPWCVGVVDRVVAASPRLLTPQIAANFAVGDPDELTNGCYVIADGGRDSSTDLNIVIDLHPDRLGRCYAAAWDTYGVAGQVPIIAVGMGELLQVLLEHDGQTAEMPDRYGDAYEPRLPWQPTSIVGLDAQWLSRWRDDMTEVVASVMAGFDARIGYPPGQNRVGSAMRMAAGELARMAAVVSSALPNAPTRRTSKRHTVQPT